MNVLQERLSEQRERVAVLTKVSLEEAGAMVDGAFNKDTVAGLLAALDREKRIFHTLLGDSELETEQ